ncbi:MAG: AbrB/MazE/SpoVT family DNA-binding domain-containing protein [Acidobacteriota bacterium]
MNATAEIDKLGRLVVPKKVRDAIGLRAGDNLDIEVRGEEIVLRTHRKAKGLHKVGNRWVYDSGVPIAHEDVNRWMNEDRERRMRWISGESTEK